MITNRPMTNNERFNALINSCRDPQRVMEMLLVFANKEGK